MEQLINVNFPKGININRAATDESVRLLNEMQSGAVDNVILKISELRNNKFSYNVFFHKFFVADGFDIKGAMTIMCKCNGKTYSRRCNCSSTILNMCRQYGPEAKLMDIDHSLKRFILLEFGFLFAQILLDVNDDSLKEILNSSFDLSDPMIVDLDTLREYLSYENEN